MNQNANGLVFEEWAQWLEQLQQPGSQQFHVGFWACEPGRWAVHYTEHEYCQLLEGEARIHDGQGGQLHLKPGDQFVIPAGFVGEWETLVACRKLYVIFEPAAT